MPRFTNEEYSDMHFIYGLCNGNGRAAAQEYANRFPNRQQPDHRIFIAVHRRLRERGRFNSYQGDRPGNVQYDENMDERILNLVRQEPTLSTRRVARRLGISHLKVWRVLRKDYQHPYHYTSVQDLVPGDPERRVAFCRHLLLNDENNPLYLQSILWTDEANFSRDGVNNFHNLHEWSHVNPHNARVTFFQTRFSVNVWAAIIGQTFIGPLFLPALLNAANYLQFLIETAPILLDEVPLLMLNRFIYQQDGAPAHFGVNVQNWLNEHFPARWIGRNGPTAWPPRSPDLTPLDFYVWGFMKSYVYSTPVATREQLVQRIEESGNLIRANLAQFNMCDAIRRRLSLCLLRDGGHFENIL